MDEMLVPTDVEKIMRVQSGAIPDLTFLVQKIAQLERLAINGKSGSVIELLYEMVPTFQPLNGNLAGQANERRGKKMGRERVESPSLPVERDCASKFKLPGAVLNTPPVAI